jgi:hypothetical protein
LKELSERFGSGIGSGLGSGQELMKLVFVHYHLNRGGVTRVLEGHLRGLQRACDLGLLPAAPHSRLPVLILYGGRAEGWPWDIGDSLPSLAVTYKALPCLDYEQEGVYTPEVVISAVEEALREAGFLPAETILHVHNHSIGKNVVLPEVIFRLAGRGWRILLQIHDFVEDFRPDNFRYLAAGMVRWGSDPVAWQGKLYPQAVHVHYAVLTSAAASVLAKSGVPTERIHFLPNPIGAVARLPARPEARKKVEDLLGLDAGSRYWLYPVRAIRRKNVGEAVLLAVLGGPKMHVGISLPATSAGELPAYHFWKSLARDLSHNVWFDLALYSQANFATHLAAADRILTTSVAEGFGLSFLEAWVHDQELVGRDLPEVVEDFRRLGVRLQRLYREVKVPASALEVASLREYLRDCYREVVNAYGVNACKSWWEQLDEKVSGETIDFGDLEERDQARILEKVLADKSFRGRMLQENSWLEDWLENPPDPDLIAANKRCVLESLGFEAIGRRLADIYEALMKVTPNEEPAPLAQFHVVAEQLLKPERFRLIRGRRLQV